MSDIGPYGVTQHADAAMVTANQLVGERVGLTTGDAVAPGVGPAQHSTAPYKRGPKTKTAPPLRRRVSSTGQPLCIAKNNTCTAWRLKESEFCRWHQPS